MTPSNHGPFDLSSNTFDNDSTHSFKLFLDLITPAEFSKLLQARVRHLLKTWPPPNQTTIAAASSSSSDNTISGSPSFESVRAFAAFFRTQDSPGPSPIDHSATTSLHALQQHLIALQTLLSFLSGRELKDIVCARLGEGGQDRSVAVQGLIDVMRNAGSDEPVAPSSSGGIESKYIEHEKLASSVRQVETINDPPGMFGQARSLAHQAGKRKILAEIEDGPHFQDLGGDQPPSKRQCTEDEEVENATNSRATPRAGSPRLSQVLTAIPFPSISCPDPPHTSSDTPAKNHSYIDNLDDTSNKITYFPDNPHSNTAKHTSSIRAIPITSETKANFDSESSRDHIVEFGQVDAKPTTESSNKGSDSSGEEDELLVTLIEDDAQPSVIMTVSPRPSAELEPALSDAAAAKSTSGGEQWPQTLILDLDIAFDAGITRAEWNRRRFRDVLGLPPKEQEKQVTDGRSVSTDNASARAAFGEESQILDNVSLSGGTRRGTITTAVASNSVAHGSLLDLAHVDPSVSRSPRSDTRISRPISPAANISDVEDPPSPPGPVLRAVNWDSKVVPVTTDPDMEVDEFDGSEDTVALGNDEPTDGIIKPTPSVFTKSFSYSHTPVIAWTGSEPVDEDNSVWNESDELAFDMRSNVEKDGDDETRSKRKLFIRLPARSKGGDSIMTSTGTDVSVSDSTSASPPAASPALHKLSSSEKDGQDIDMGTNILTKSSEVSSAISSSSSNEKDGDQTLVSEQSKKPGAVFSGRSRTETPRSEISQSQVAVAAASTSTSSRTASASSNNMPQQQHGHRPYHSHTPHTYPRPHHPHAQPYHPGPWFGAMFYVPLRGPPHPRAHPHGHTSHHQHPYPHQHMMPQAAAAAAMDAQPTKTQSNAGHSTQSRGGASSSSLVAGGSGNISASASAVASGSGSGSGSASTPAVPSVSVSDPSTPDVGTPKRGVKRKNSRQRSVSPPSALEEEEEMNPNVAYTDDVGIKETAVIRRRCFNCHAIQAPSWRKSKLNVGKILCNKCGIYESTHMTARPLKTRPRRSSGDAGPMKKRKPSKKPALLS